MNVYSKNPLLSLPKELNLNELFTFSKGLGWVFVLFLLSSFLFLLFSYSFLYYISYSIYSLSLILIIEHCNENINLESIFPIGITPCERAQ